MDVWAWSTCAVVSALLVGLVFVQRRARAAEREAAARELEVATLALRAREEQLDAQRAELEASRRALTRLEQLETMARLAGGAAHDFNNVLTVILAEVATLRDATDAETREAAEHIASATKSASEITKPLLALSRQKPAAIRPIDLTAQVGAVRKLLQHLVPESVAFTLDVPTEPLAVLGDLARLQQILFNLVTNARDAMPEGGKLDVRLDACDLHVGDVLEDGRPAPSAGRYARLTVSDTGTGMDGATLERAFEPFFTTKRTGRGSGLGLASVRSIVHDLLGFVVVRTAVGSGTLFAIYLPLTTERPGDTPAHGGAPASARPGRVALVADDESPVRRIVARVLVGEGFVVHEAPDGAAAIELLDTMGDVFDLVLTDSVMPRASGHRVAAHAREHAPRAKVLLVTEHPSPQDGEAKYFHVLAKPFTPTLLVDKVRSLLGEAPAAPPA